MNSRLTIVFATPIGEDTLSIEVYFENRDEALEVAQTVRVGGTTNPWASYVENVEVTDLGQIP